MTSALRASLAALLLAAIMLVLLWPREPAIPPEPVNGRLPTLAIPDHYLLRLNIFPEQPSFRGEVEITLHLQASTRSLYLHGRDLTVQLVEARRAGETAVSGRYQQLTPQGLARIDFDEKIPAGFLTLVLHYDGHYTNTSEGLSRVQVGKDWYVFSQFHPIEARRVFPGFDEPSFKASFELEILSWQQDAVIGNSLPNETRQLADNIKLTRLSPTPRLPSFLLNLSVGPFDVVNGPVVPANEVRAQPLTLRAVTTRGQGIHTRFALDHTATMLSRFEQYFAVPFPFDKLDLIAVPDTSSNVLENPGAINFRDQLMLVDDHASVEDRQMFLAHHAHALAHQWFGDLVTMPWWDDLWLNEGFAEWLGYEVAIKSHPEFPLALAMQQQLEHAMQRDGLSPQVRIRQSLSREQDVQSTFNTVVYDKAMGLMRMYQRYLGDEQFRQGLRNYFARHAFGNATATDLFLSLGDSVADPAVTRSFDSFLDQPGLPQIALTQHCDNGKLQLHLRQQAYRPVGSEQLSSIWQLPVCLRTPGDTPPACRLLTEPEVNWTPGWRCGELVLPNAAGAGYYRWQVSAEHRQALLAQLPQLPLTEVLDIVANLDAALRAGALSIEEYWQSLPAMAQHAEPTVLKAALDSWRYILQAAPEPVRQQWRQRLLRFFRTDAATPHKDNTALLQFRALDLHDDALRQQLRQQHGASIKPLLRAEPLPDLPNALALSIALADDSTLLKQAPHYFRDESRNSVRAALIQALSWQQDPSQLASVQQLLLSADLRIHERWQLLKASLLQPALAAANWQWLRQQSAAMLALLPDFRHSQLPELAEAICDAEQWQQTEQFLRDHRDTLAITDAALASTASHVRQCLSLRAAFAAVPAQP